MFLSQGNAGPATCRGRLIPVQVTHDQAVDWALRSKRLVSKKAALAGFLASLSSPRLDLRSAPGVSLPFAISHFTAGAESKALNTVAPFAAISRPPEPRDSTSIR